MDFLQYCTFTGAAFPEPFVKLELEKELNKAKLLPKVTGKEGRELQKNWQVYRRILRRLAVKGGAVRVKNHVIEPLLKALGYSTLIKADDVLTREGQETGGYLLQIEGENEENFSGLRVWSSEFEEDLDAPTKRGNAYRFSYVKIAQRVLLAKGERVGLLTNGIELRVLISDPVRPDSQIIIPIATHWKNSPDVPDTYLLVLALTSPGGVRLIPELVDKARLQQAVVTKELRVQAKLAIRDFIRGVLAQPENEGPLASREPDPLARELWQEGLIVVYRLLFVLHLEASSDLARQFRFASGSLWRGSFSPNTALAPYVRRVLDEGMETGEFLEGALRSLFRMFSSGELANFPEMPIRSLGGVLFGKDSTPLLSGLRWGERSVAVLLDKLLWTMPRRGGGGRERIHYGTLRVEDLGRVYEALLELEAGIAGERMCRLRREKLEVVLPLSQGEKYRPVSQVSESAEWDDDDGDEGRSSKKKSKVQWIEEIPKGEFYLRAGLGRKSSGSYYTPESFVRFLVEETLGPLVAECCPAEEPQPEAILRLKVLDPAMGSGHFLVGACRFLADRLYEACCACDSLEKRYLKVADEAATEEERTAAVAKAREYGDRVRALAVEPPTPEGYLPSHAVEESSLFGVSAPLALAICRRLVAVRCLYGVDKNPLAVELAKLSLWIESHSEGLPLTFLDHRLLAGDSLTGPFFEYLFREPVSGDDVQKLLWRDVNDGFRRAIASALTRVRQLEATVGVDVRDIERKAAAKAKLDRDLAPFVVLAAAWSGGAMLGEGMADDVAYSNLFKYVGENGDLPEDLSVVIGFGEGKDKSDFARGEQTPLLLKAIALGLGVAEVSPKREDLLTVLSRKDCPKALAYDLVFPEVFYPDGEVIFDGQTVTNRRGFDVVFGNPPWDKMLPADKEFFASYNFAILEAKNKHERAPIEEALKADEKVLMAYEKYIEAFRTNERLVKSIYKYQIALVNGKKTIGKQDAFRAFMERNAKLLKPFGLTGVLVPSGFHANEGATGVRRLYFQEMACQCCYSFENKNKFFEIDSRIKFATVIAKKGDVTRELSCAFYLHDENWLFKKGGERPPLNYSLDFIEKTGSEYLSLLELQSAKDVEVAKVCFANGELFGKVCERLNIKLGRELNETDDDGRFTPTNEVLEANKDPREPDVAKELLSKGYLVLHEGKTFHHYDDRWGERPRYLVSLKKVGDKKDWLDASQFYRLAFRDVSSSTNERTAIFSYLPPALFLNTSPCERQPGNRSNASALFLMALANCFTSDWGIRLKVAAHVNLFILLNSPLGVDLSLKTFLAHSALRLTCNHKGYEPLWREQLGKEWREKTKEPLNFPAVAKESDRWEIRGAIDALVASSYKLNREQYTHILSTFNHKSYEKAPKVCLAKFDELEKIGVDAFVEKYDPYHDIPLNEELPKGAIELPIEEIKTATTDDGFALTSPPVKEKPKEGKKRKN